MKPFQLIALLLMGYLTLTSLAPWSQADDSCKEHGARLADLEKRVYQLEEIIKQTPLPASSYRTSTGAVFSRATHDGFGKAWKAPDGTVWSEYQGKFSNDGASKNGIVTDSAATRACGKINGSLPTKQNLEKLKTYFELDGNGYLTDQGRKDLYKVFPDMNGRWFWSSSVHAGDDDDAYYFNGNGGGIDEGNRDNHSGSVRCVAGS